MAVTELYEGTRHTEGDLRGHRAIRRFLVTNASPDFAVAQAGMPVLGSRFFFGSLELVATNYNTIGTPTPRVSIVEWFYDDSEFVRQVTQGISRAEEVYPIYVAQANVGDVRFLNQPASKGITWVLKELKYERADEVYRVEMHLPVWGRAEKQTVRKQIGNIHFFDDTFWQYQGVQAIAESAIDPAPRTTVTHTWVSDPGFVGLDADFLPAFLDPSYTILPKITRGGLLSYERRPFEQYITIPINKIDDGTPNGAGQFTRPAITMIAPKKIDLNGYASLPGLPILDP